MIQLNELLVCPVCHADLPLNDGSDGCIGCFRCSWQYHLKQGVYNMTPLPLPDEYLKSRWDTWQKLQDNFVLACDIAPEFNLSVGLREDAQAFKEFAQPSGLTLDVGCGPQAQPSYLPEGCRVIGIDPLAGQQPREFGFVQGISEYLPFRDKTFDHILYASSLDHIMDPKRSLAEAVRCLKPGGKISLWIDGLASEDASPNPSGSERYRGVARKGLKSLWRHGWFTKMGVRRTLSYLTTVARMRVPEGANDCFHFVHLKPTTVSDWLTELDLVISRQQTEPSADTVFIQAKHL